MSFVTDRYQLDIDIDIQQQRESLLPHPVPEFPWQKVGADIFTLYGKDLILSSYCGPLLIISYNLHKMVSKKQ